MKKIVVGKDCGPKRDRRKGRKKNEQQRFSGNEEEVKKGEGESEKGKASRRERI